MPYFGGKGQVGKGGVGDWIAKQLPWVRKSVYVEPFAGMLGVLLRRKPVVREVVNDLDHKVVNWWRVVRDHPEELVRLLSCTPYSRVEFERCLEDTEDEIEAARRFTVMVTQSVHRGTIASRSSFCKFLGTSSISNVDWRDRILALKQRMKLVQLENIDAVKLLERVARHDDAVVYCDPPYATADTTKYAISGFDKGAMVEVLRAQKGSVAISGYNDEWDALGWRCEEKGRFSRGPKTSIAKVRIEKLWMNYPTADKVILQ